MYTHNMQPTAYRPHKDVTRERSAEVDVAEEDQEKEDAASGARHTGPPTVALHARVVPCDVTCATVATRSRPKQVAQ
jgi:hypothetical protein